MPVNFEPSRTGELTCSVQGKYLHSKYNPQTEGERFAENIQADFSPLCVFILEPALSYCASPLKKKFPGALLCAIRFSKDFSQADDKWDKVFYLKDSPIALSEDLFNSLGEEKLISSLAFDWTASKNIFPEESMLAWQEIKKAILKARDVLATRAYFSKRWLKNSLIFASKIQKTLLLEKGSLPVIIAASGPSLKTSLPFLKKYRNSFFLIAVSSAFMPLAKKGIRPDLVISSDGGYWAKKHLNFSGSENVETVFALEAESAAPKKLLTQGEILPLCYEDGLEREFLDSIGSPYMLSERNGTVAGTALCFAHSLTDGRIYLCGLDQAPAPSFQHTQPNALENDNARKDFRLKSAETRMTASRFNSQTSLEIYRNWFISNSEYFSKRVFRLSDNFKYDFSLGKISEINWEEFMAQESLLSKSAPNKKPILFKAAKIKVSGSERKVKILAKLRELSQSQKFADEVFPMDSILIKRKFPGEKCEELKSKLKEKIEKLLKECEKLL
ncbi:DUF115 domain-containing protein [Treponema ruminis]|uniref:6-hydroxymethylpterin diphosphokinase MptE-like domain-containing protein n=1 Tax=Treponema ruminis TaxID=744515 RepID=A0A7W8LLW8_9SPIR|nr:6-hydroxymethylpterin diphosphokinase MptE-like protein [Treponema ruminis]MBB5225768.1 hypothetical protein [Treponema ruminis]QSI02458.1 DUF115 domain-containing protein [Treponema ruminis]